MPLVSMGEIRKDKDYPETVELDLSEKRIKSLRIGDRVEIVLKGKIGLLQIPPSGATKDNPPTLGMILTSKKMFNESEFSKLADDNDDEE